MTDIICINWIEINEHTLDQIPKYQDLLVYPFPTDYVFTGTFGLLPKSSKYVWTYHELTPYGVETTMFTPTHYAILNTPQDN